MKNQNLKNNKYSSYGEFLESRKLEEAESYDEPSGKPTASMRQEDWAAKDKLDFVSNLAGELTMFIEDGEQLEPSQLTIIDNLYDNINKLKRQIEGREEVKQQEESDMYDGIDNPNL
jgi:hypothetical protein